MENRKDVIGCVDRNSNRNQKPFQGGVYRFQYLVVCLRLLTDHLEMGDSRSDGSVGIYRDVHELLLACIRNASLPNDTRADQDRRLTGVGDGIDVDIRVDMRHRIRYVSSASRQSISFEVLVDETDKMRPV